MLTLQTVLEVKKLLGKGLSQREVARQLGVGRATIGAIASGKRGLHGRLESSCKSKNNDHWSELTGDFVRCPECGSKVLLPCVGCAAHRFRHQARRQPNEASSRAA